MIAMYPTPNPSPVVDKAIIFIGLITIVVVIGALYLTAQGTDAAVAWALAGTGVGAIAGILVPSARV